MRWNVSARFALVIAALLLGIFSAACFVGNCNRILIKQTAQATSTHITIDTQSVKFPYSVEGTPLIAERLISYEGTFLEDGGESEVVGVAALMLKNQGKDHIRSAQIRVLQGERILTFELTHLPPGKEILVLEKNKQLFYGDNISACVGVAEVIRDNGWMNKTQITPTGRRSLQIMNLTNEKLENVIVHYKTFYAPAGFYVGGITYSICIEKVKELEAVQLFPYPFEEQSSAVVWVSLE